MVNRLRFLERSRSVEPGHWTAPGYSSVVEEFRVAGSDVELGVLVRAGGPTILFLHGLAGHRGEWTPVIDRLDPGIGLIIPDLRAHGTSRRRGPMLVDRESYVTDCVAVIEQLGTGPVVVVGQSMGGIVATLLARSQPDLVKRLVLIETGMDAMDDAALDGLRLWFDSWPEEFADHAHAAEFFGINARSTPGWVEGLGETEGGLVRQFDSEAMIEAMRSLASAHRWREWESISAPTTLIRGANSMIANDDVERMLDIRPATELFVVDDSGHDVHLDQPEQVAAIVSDRLSDA